MGISKLTVENRFIDYFKESTEINKGLTLIDKKLGGTIPLEIIFEDLAEDYWYDPELRE
jgi:predicted RND superfamily exporter protein